MKKLLLLTAVFPLLAFGAPNDIKVSQQNSSGTAWIDRIFATGANKVIGTDANGIVSLQNGGSGSGTVTSASVVTANGISATVTNPTTTPAFTFTLGAITPTSIGSATTATTQAIGDNSTKIATTAYVDASVAADIEIKNPVVAATNAALLFSPSYSNGSSGVGATLTGGIGVLIVDGYTPVLNDRILVKNEASTLTQGVYTVTRLGTIGIGYILTRATDFNQAANILYGDTVGVLQGTVNANQQFTMNNQNAITVGTTAITFAQSSGGSQLTQGTNIVITGNSIATTTAPTWTGIVTTAAANVTTANAMGALAIDVTKGLNTKSISADQTFTFSGTPANSNQWFSVLITADSTARVATIPSSFSVNRNATITTVTVPASGKILLTWQYDGSVYNLYGDPVVTTGTGNYVLQTGGTLIAPALGTPASGNLTNTVSTTSAAGTGGTGIATQAYADAAALASHLGTFASPNTAAGAITWTSPVYNIYTSAASTRTYTLPAASTYVNRAFVLNVAVGTGHVNVQPASGAALVLAGVLLTADHYVQAATSAPGNYICFTSDGTNWTSLGSSGTWADAASP